MDPASLQVLISRLTGVAEEMGAVLRRAAYSPNIKERADCSAALFTASGELLVQAEHIPVHLGSMPASVAAALAAFPAGSMKPGRQIILNDPFAGGTHLNDITLVAPCFVDDELVGWVANRAHHADLGGMAPGSIPPDAVEIYQEGLRIPPVALSSAVVAMLCANSRTPLERRGDLDAQIGANRVGVARLAALVAEGAVFEPVLDYGERRMRAALAAMPDGEWFFEDVLDSSGPRVSQQSPVRVALRLTVLGEAVTFDFSGSDSQQPGNVNAVEAVTVSAVSFALRSALDPGMPSNGGAMRPVSVVCRPGSVVAAAPPVAVGAGNVEVSQRVADVCLGALALAVPGRVGAASQGTMNNVMIGSAGSAGAGGAVGAAGAARAAGSGGAPGSAGAAGSAGWVYYETIAGGQGARPTPPPHSVDAHGGISPQASTEAPGRAAVAGREVGVAGQSGMHTGMTNSLNSPIEALERSYPLRVLRYRLRRGSGGTGAAPGGDGIERDVQVLEACTLSLITERRLSRPWGLNGGGPGAPGENWLLPAGDESAARRLPDKCTVELQAGDVLRMLTPGGGGYGTG